MFSWLPTDNWSIVDPALGAKVQAGIGELLVCVLGTALWAVAIAWWWFPVNARRRLTAEQSPVIRGIL